MEVEKETTSHHPPPHSMSEETVTVAQARYEPYTLPTQLLTKKFDNLRGLLAHWYNEYANNKDEIDSDFKVIGETICHHVAASPLSFEGASLFRTVITNGLFCDKAFPDLEELLSGSKNLLQKDFEDMKKGTHRNLFISMELLNTVSLSNSEFARANNWLSKTEGAGTNHLLRIYVFLQYLTCQQQILLVLNKASAKLLKMREAWLKINPTSTNFEKNKAAFLGEYSLNYSLDLGFKIDLAIEYMENDRRNANLLMYFLKNGGGDFTNLKKLATDQLLHLDLWKENWQQRELAILKVYRFKQSLGDMVLRHGKKGAEKKITLFKTEFDKKTGKINTKKQRLMKTATVAESDWNVLWKRSAEDYVFGGKKWFQKKTDSATEPPVVPSEEEQASPPTEEVETEETLQEKATQEETSQETTQKEPLVVSDITFGVEREISVYNPLSETEKSLDKDVKGLFEFLKDNRDGAWAGYYTEDGHGQRRNWDFLDDISATLKVDDNFFMGRSPTGILNKKLELGNVSTEGPTDLDELKGEKFLLGDQIDEYIGTLIDHFANITDKTDKAGLKQRLAPVLQTMDCGSKKPGDPNTYWSYPDIKLSYCQVSLTRWLYKYLYLATSRNNTYGINDQQFAYFQARFCRTSKFKETPTEKFHVSDLAKGQHKN